MNHFNNPHYLSSRTIDLISSDYAEKYSDSHVKWNLNNKIIAPPNTHLIVGLLNMNLPYSWYSIRSVNNQFTLKTMVSSVEYEVDFTISEGNYEGQTLVSALNTLFTTQRSNLGLTTLSINLNVNNNKYYFSCTPEPDYFTFTNASCYKEIGASSYEGTTYTGISPYYFDKCYDLSGDKSIYCRLHSKGLKNINTKNISNILANIPCICPPSNTLYYMPNVVEYFKVDDDLGTIEIELLDENMNQIGDFYVSNPFRLTLSVHYSYNKQAPITYKHEPEEEE